LQYIKQSPKSLANQKILMHAGAQPGLC